MKIDVVKNNKKEKTLLLSLLLSFWAPLATGIAVYLSGGSVTQIADFLRRTVEFIALFFSWWIFRYINSKIDLEPMVKMRWEKRVNYGVTTTIGCSGLVMLYLGIHSLFNYTPKGNTVLGLIIASMGLVVNIVFWRRYSKFEQKESSSIIKAQCQLYLAKIMVDICVIIALGAIAFSPTHRISGYIDALGTLAVAIYLLGKSSRTFKELLRNPATHSNL